MIPFTYLCPRLLSSAFVFLVTCIARLLISRFSFVKQPPSVEKRKGFFLPRNIPTKNFPKIFSKHPKRLFPDFLARICDEGNGCLPLAYGGGTPFLGACGLAASALSLSFSFLCSGYAGGFRSLSCWVALPFFLVGFPASVLPRSLGSIRTTSNRAAGFRSLLPFPASLDYGSTPNGSKVAEIG